MIRVLARIVVDALIVATALFGAAGTLAWGRAWLLLVVFVAVRAASAIAVFRANPALLAERATVLIHRDQPWIDRLLLGTYMMAAFIGVPAVAARDVFHWHLPASPPPLLADAGLALFALGWVIIAVALRANPFAVTVVRRQTNRQHTVVDSGIYGVIRHPMYAANPLVNVGLSLWLGSYAGVAFAAIPFALLLIRIRLEEGFLRRHLPGYGEYMARVPYRLVPGVW